MTQRVHNFNPGPAALPLPVLEQVQHDLLDFAGSGMSILEMSHRSAIYEGVHYQAMADLRTLLGCTDEQAILFMGGGAQTQFALVALNLLPPGTYAHYLVTGHWSLTALHEAQKLGEARQLWSSAATHFDHVPTPADIHSDPHAMYVHYTSNNTIVGTQYAFVPDTGTVPLIGDMSSDLLSRPLAVGRFGLIYAGAQKNMGPAGVTVVIVRRDAPRALPCRPAVDAELRAHGSAEFAPEYTTGLCHLCCWPGGAVSAGAGRAGHHGGTQCRESPVAVPDDRYLGRILSGLRAARESVADECDLSVSPPPHWKKNFSPPAATLGLLAYRDTAR